MGTNYLDKEEKTQVRNINRLHRTLDSLLMPILGVSYMDLPDLVFLSDYCWDGMEEKDFHDSAIEVIEELAAEGEIPDSLMVHFSYKGSGSNG